MKHRGDIAQTNFVYQALKRGFHVCEPYGDNTPFDFILDSPSKGPLKIQVKSSNTFDKGVTQFSVYRSKNRPYQLKDVDFFALYCFTTDSWFIVPSAFILPRKCIRLHTGSELKEWWGLLV